jgi:hypothetical protein
MAAMSLPQTCAEATIFVDVTPVGRNEVVGLIVNGSIANDIVGNLPDYNRAHACRKSVQR